MVTFIHGNYSYMWLTFNGCTSTSELNTELHDSWSDHSLVPIKFYDFCILFCAHQYHISQWEFCHTPRIYNIIDSLISWLRLFTESYLSDADNIASFENTTVIIQINLLCILLFWPFLFWLTGMEFSNSTMLSVSDKSDSISEFIQWIKNKIKLYILGCVKNVYEFIRQLIHYVALKFPLKLIFLHENNIHKMHHA